MLMRRKKLVNKEIILENIVEIVVVISNLMRKISVIL